MTEARDLDCKVSQINANPYFTRYYFDETATEENSIPTVNFNLTKNAPRVLPYTPLFGFDTDFGTQGMRHLDQVLVHVPKVFDTTKPKLAYLQGKLVLLQLQISFRNVGSYQLPSTVVLFHFPGAS